MIGDALRFDVFGRLMLVERRGGEWRVYQLGGDGKRSLIRDLAIPGSLSEDELGTYLADLFHEYASARHPEVRRLR